MGQSQPQQGWGQPQQPAMQSQPVLTSAKSAPTNHRWILMTISHSKSLFYKKAALYAAFLYSNKSGISKMCLVVAL